MPLSPLLCSPSPIVPRSRDFRRDNVARTRSVKQPARHNDVKPLSLWPLSFIRLSIWRGPARLCACVRACVSVGWARDRRAIRFLSQVCVGRRARSMMRAHALCVAIVVGKHLNAREAWSSKFFARGFFSLSFWWICWYVTEVVCENSNCLQYSCEVSDPIYRIFTMQRLGEHFVSLMRRIIVWWIKWQ